MLASFVEANIVKARTNGKQRCGAWKGECARKQSGIPEQSIFSISIKSRSCSWFKAMVYGLHESIWSALWIAITIRVSSLDMTWPALTKTCSSRRFDDVLQSPLFLIPISSFRVTVMQYLLLEILHLHIFLTIFLYYDFNKYYYLLVLYI